MVTTLRADDVKLMTMEDAFSSPTAMELIHAMNKEMELCRQAKFETWLIFQLDASRPGKRCELDRVKPL